jgi:DeoR family glycerol-3-phosphate regulon repressor
VVPEERRNRILARLAVRQQVSVNDLADDLRVSRETIRRDLERLAEHGLVRKVHGGAVNVPTALEPPLHSRETVRRVEKRFIARLAAPLFKSGDTLFIDAGTTTTAFAKELAAVRELTVITNSVEVARMIASAKNGSRVHMLGGDYWGEGAETRGPFVLEQIAQFQPDHAVLTVGAVDSREGIFDFNMEEATVARAMVRYARATTVLADSSKLDRSALIKVCELKEISRLITDRRIDPAFLSRMCEAGIQVICGTTELEGDHERREDE